MLNYSIPRLVVSALRGGSGKTFLSLSLIALWRKKGLKVIPFKKGPDYIDAGWLAQAAKGDCFNLDLFMILPKEIIRSFIERTNDAQVAVIEGNKGLYDGVDPEGTYSTARLAKLLNAPVIIVVDCTKATNTVSAMVLGCQRFDPEVHLAGVILNRVATGRQESLIRNSIHRNCKIPVLGAIPRLKKHLLPERHMGLLPYQEHPVVEEGISRIAEIGSRYIDLDGIWRITNEAEPLRNVELEKPKSHTPRPYSARQGRLKSEIKIGVIKDSAFQFYYPENLEGLKERGAEIVEISALREKELPQLDALYIGGGFPETHAIALAENIRFKNSLCKEIENGLPVYAECGGLMYLGESLVVGNKTYPMSGVLPLVFGLEKKPQAHGYTIIEVMGKNPFFPKGSVLRGHEFHYSRLLDITKSKTFTKRGHVYFAFRMKRGQGIVNKMDGLCYKNVLATYTHLHALGTREWVDGLVEASAQFNLLGKQDLILL